MVALLRNDNNNNNNNRRMHRIMTMVIRNEVTVHELIHLSLPAYSCCVYRRLQFLILCQLLMMVGRIAQWV